MITKNTNNIFLSRVIASFDRAAPHYAEHAPLQTEIALNLLNDLRRHAFQSERVLDLGCGPGTALSSLRDLLQPTSVVALDVSSGMLRCVQEAPHLESPSKTPSKTRKNKKSTVQCVCADLNDLPFVEGAFNSIFASMSLQWSCGLEKAFLALRRVLLPNGYLAFSIPLQGSLKELQYCFSRVGVPEADYYSLDDIQSVLQSAGWELVLQRSVTHVLWFRHFMDVVQNLKDIGANQKKQPSHPGLTSRHYWKQIGKAYAQYKDDRGYFPATYEICYVVAKKRAVS